MDKPQNNTEKQSDSESFIHNGKIDWESIFGKILTDTDARKELSKWTKKEFGININKFLPALTGQEDQDSRTAIEDMDIPHREIAENVYELQEEGYNRVQIAKMLGIYPTAITKILNEEERFKAQILKATLKEMGFFERFKFKIINFVS